MGVLFSLLFLIVLGVLALVGRVPLALFGLYAVLSLITILAYGLDKSAAQNNRWRTQENTLHLFSLFGGWPGALIAQKIFRHKTQKAALSGDFLVDGGRQCGRILLGAFSSGRQRAAIFFRTHMNPVTLSLKMNLDDVVSFS